jgi:hypothetical protein
MNSGTAVAFLAIAEPCSSSYHWQKGNYDCLSPTSAKYLLILCHSNLPGNLYLPYAAAAGATSCGVSAAGERRGRSPLKAPRLKNWDFLARVWAALASGSSIGRAERSPGNGLQGSIAVMIRPASLSAQPYCCLLLWGSPVIVLDGIYRMQSHDDLDRVQAAGRRMASTPAPSFWTLQIGSPELDFCSLRTGDVHGAGIPARIKQRDFWHSRVPPNQQPLAKPPRAPIPKRSALQPHKKICVRGTQAHRLCKGQKTLTAAPLL